MPPRRKTANSTRNAQPTLSFHSKPTKVTKPTIADTSVDKNALEKSSALAEEVAEIEEPEVAVVKSKPKPKPKDKSTLQAEKVTDAQVRKYWLKEEDARKAPRVHQQDLSTHEKILRHFDICTQFGPCMGVTRIRRWKRADGLGLKPPIEVLAVILKEEQKAKSENKEWLGQKAYLDELMNGRYAPE